MPLTGHLTELRRRILVAAAVFFLLTAAALTQSEKLIAVFTDMGLKYGYRFVYLAPQELLLQQFKVAALAGFLLSLPLILYEIYAFARPGLTGRESRILRVVLIAGLFFFAVGAFFAYTVTIPFMLNFLIRLSDNTVFAAQISVENYLSFVLLIFTIFGFIFEMPLVSALLSRFGVLNPRMLKKARPFAIVFIFFLAAVITPPDVFSQILVAVPMILLYQLSILVSKIFRTCNFPEETV